MVQCGGARGAWVLFSGSGAATGHSPYVAFATKNGQFWRPVLEERFTESAIMPVKAPEGPGTYPGPFTAVSDDAAIFVGFSPFGQVPTSVDIATDYGEKLSSNRSVAGIFEPTGVAFVNGDQGWVIGIASANKGSAIEATSDGGRTWARQWSTSQSRAVTPPTQKTVVADASRFPTLNLTMREALIGLNNAQMPEPVQGSGISHVITKKKAVQIATSTQFGKGARVVAVGLVWLSSGASTSTTAWLVLIDPPGPHTCMSLGRDPVTRSCRLNVYAIAIDAVSGDYLWYGTSTSSALRPLRIFSRMKATG
jgi:hypothetical protein